MITGFNLSFFIIVPFDCLIKTDRLSDAPYGGGKQQRLDAISYQASMPNALRCPLFTVVLGKERIYPEGIPGPALAADRGQSIKVLKV